MVCDQYMQNDKNGATTRPAEGGESCDAAAFAQTTNDVRHGSPPQSRRLNRGTPRTIARRGNSLILVTAILVLLVIVASAYISRIQGSRITGASVQYQSGRESISNVVADDLAREIAEALFPRPVDLSAAPALDPFSANTPRLPIAPNAVRHGPDLISGVRFNNGQFEVIPGTNWPDLPGYPAGPGAPLGQDLSTLGIGEWNPIGGPGFDDARWLASTEPMRWVHPGTDTVIGTQDDFEIFSHWLHMSNIARAENGYRICFDIANVGTGTLMTDLSIPVEQWLAMRPGGVGASSTINSLTGLPRMPDNLDNFFDRINRWFSVPGAGGDYTTSYTDPEWIPPNFLRLSDLDGDGVKFNFGDRPNDEFFPGSARNLVSRVFCDTDGDGFTDSLWFLAPSSIDRGVRTVIGVRVVDNAGMANVNVATRFVPAEGGFLPDNSRTKGTTPADLAFVGQLDTPPITFPQTADLDNYNLGFCDFPGHSMVITNAPLDTSPVNYFSGIMGSPLTYWQAHVRQTGMPMPTVGFGAWLPTQANRLAWWLNVGVAGPLTPSPKFGFTPYTIADELELRMFHGNNNPWSFSRLEHSLTLNANQNDTFIRGGAFAGNEESTEYLYQRSNRGLVIDKRRMMTTYNATRNDLMPNWLWPVGMLGELDWSHPSNFANVALRQKVDLRAPGGDYNRDSVSYNDADRLHLYHVLRRALLSVGPSLADSESYYGITLDQMIRSNRMAAGLAANIKAYTDENQSAPLDESILIESLASLGENTPGVEYRAYGLEAQPFLVEAMIGHVYKPDTVALRRHPSDEDGTPIDVGDMVVCAESPNTTFVVVQIANPFDKTILLNGTHERFELEVFGRPFDLSALPSATGTGLVGLSPATYGEPTTLTLVMMDEEFEGDSFEAPMANALKLTGGESNNIIYIDVKNYGSPWSTDRGTYDAGVNSHYPATEANKHDGVQLVRVVADPFDPSGQPARVVIDRFNVPGGAAAGTFRGTVTRLDAPGPCSPEPDQDLPWPGVINVTDDNEYWFQWAHVKRAWGIRPDLNLRSPRFVFASHIVTEGDGVFGYDALAPNITFDIDGDPDWPARFNHDNNANEFPDKDFDGDPENLGFAMQMLHKDGDFEQLGELFNVFCHAHLLRFTNVGYDMTETTFAEAMQKEVQLMVGASLPQQTRVNRLDPLRQKSVITGKPAGALNTPLPPALPAAMRVLEAFTLDGRGFNAPLPPPNTIPPVDEIPLRLANSFTGAAIHGLININTATVEVLRMLPNTARIIHSEGFPTMPLGGFSAMPRSALAEAIVQGREMYNGLAAPLTGSPHRTGTPQGPDYRKRQDAVTGMRGGRGFATKGELLTLNKDANNDITEFNQLLVKSKAWSFDFAANEPFEDANPPDGVESTYISTDVLQPADPDSLEGDQVAADSEEHNLLFSGMANLITTTSDTFTVYFRVRSFRQNPTTGVWDATNPEYIIDDSRYVMLVDRSNVNGPSDKPRILYLEKLPN